MDIAGIPVREVTAVLEIISSISSTLALDEILAEFTEKAAQIVGADSCAISRWDRQNDTLVVLADYISPEVVIPSDDVSDVGVVYPLADYPATAQVLHECVPLIVYIDDPAADEAEKALLGSFRWDGVLIVPMLYKEQAIGLMELYIDDKDSYQFTNDDVILCQTLANQAAVAIENARLRAETEQRAEQMAVLRELDQAITASLRISDVYHALANHAARLLSYDRMSITLLEGDAMRVTYVVSEDEITFPIGSTLPRKTSAVGWVAAQGQPLLRHNITADMRFAEDEPLVVGGIQSEAIIPLRVKGRVIGTWNIGSRRVGAYSPDDLVIAQYMADQLSIAIENARLYQEAEDGRLHAEAIQVIGRALASELDYRRIVRSVADFAYRLAGAQFVYVAVPEADGFRLVAVAGRDEGDASAVHSVEAPFDLLSQEPLERAVRGKAPVVVADIQHDPISAAWREEAKARGLRAMVAVPLLSHDRVVGVLAAYARQPAFFDPDDVAMLMALASQAAVAIQNARLFAELEAQREALHRVSLRLVNAQEEERHRIARELHDELGQALTALKINLDVARRALPTDVPLKLRHSVLEASSLAARTLEAARSLSLELRPAMLDDLGLVSALRWEIDRYEQRTGQAIHFEADLADAVLQPELEITIYRIVAEALTNVARHAHASHVRVYLRVENHQVLASVEDDGVGFDAAGWFDSPAERQSLGLVSMRERAELLGGRLEVISEPGHGTKVRVQLPIGD